MVLRYCQFQLAYNVSAYGPLPIIMIHSVYSYCIYIIGDQVYYIRMWSYGFRPVDD